MGENLPRLIQWNIIGFIERHGNSNSPKFYEFADSNPLGEESSIDSLFYRLKQIDIDGTFEYSEIISVRMGVPDK